MSAGGVHTGALLRSIRAMTFGAIDANAVLRDNRARDGLGEIDQQFQLPISGFANETLAFTEVELDFAAPFLDGYDERQSPYSDPTFTYGLHMKKGDAIFSVLLRRYVVKHENYVGAVIAVGAYCPVNTSKFEGFIHLNFQGFGTPHSDETGEDL